eukprot:gnl/MRDRNA2_/MRDRNA2_86736_c0_seq2.p1 gnl/MRDRNA2_/MRDRNA2_86736_c0~~gnl/MRDRNA2_/MRDRNA2_86736_c0_seq2.p1  ORF type:complete len:373 (-),score=54.37 gnl/MRDRNA2_/MRDRNA2_86736_c0_seq2:149-1267(-)
MLTLYTCVTDGCGQDIIYKMAYKTPTTIVYWSCFVFFTSIGLVNVLIGLFCENVFASAREQEKEASTVNRERRRLCAESLKVLFKEMDTDSSSTISREEFVEALENNTHVEQAFEEMELGDYWRLFDVLDVDGGGYLDIEEFFNGALLLANADEPAKAKDTIGTYLLVQAMSKNVYAALEMLKEIAGRNARVDAKASTNPLAIQGQQVVSNAELFSQLKVLNESASGMKSGLYVACEMLKENAGRNSSGNFPRAPMESVTMPTTPLANEEQPVSRDFLCSQLKMMHASINVIGERQISLKQQIQQMNDNITCLSERQMRLEHEVGRWRPSPRILVRGEPSPNGKYPNQLLPVQASPSHIEGGEAFSYACVDI